MVRVAKADDFARIMPLLDEQFVFGKGRQLSLAQRFPSVFCAIGGGTLLLMEEHGEILAALMCRHFNLLQGELRWRGAMIGAVWTRPERRREGLASRLLEFAAKYCHDEEADFAVLWTDQPAFYARLGWVSGDHGVLGECVISNAEKAIDTRVNKISTRSADIVRIEKIRELWRAWRVSRSPNDYAHVPLPSLAVDCLIAESNNGREAYALLGSIADTAILYEMVGHADGFAPLWHEMGRDHRRLLVNDAVGSTSQRWLADTSRFVWLPKPLAMWLQLSQRVDSARFSGWYIPFLDRI